MVGSLAPGTDHLDCAPWNEINGGQVEAEYSPEEEAEKVLLMVLFEPAQTMNDNVIGRNKENRHYG